MARSQEALLLSLNLCYKIATSMFMKMKTWLFQRLQNSTLEVESLKSKVQMRRKSWSDAEKTSLKNRK